MSIKQSPRRVIDHMLQKLLKACTQAKKSFLHIGYPGGGGGTWVFRGVHTFVIKIKKYP